MAFVASVAWIDLVCGEVVALLQVHLPLAHLRLEKSSCGRIQDFKIGSGGSYRNLRTTFFNMFFGLRQRAVARPQAVGYVFDIPAGLLGQVSLLCTRPIF